MPMEAVGAVTEGDKIDDPPDGRLLDLPLGLEHAVGPIDQDLDIQDIRIRNARSTMPRTKITNKMRARNRIQDLRHQRH